MTTTIGDINPIQGLLDYIQDIKPYHTKVVQVTTEYVHQEDISVTMAETLGVNIHFEFNKEAADAANAGDSASYSYSSSRIGGFGGISMFGLNDPAAWPIIPTNIGASGIFDPNHLGYDSSTNTIVIPGDRTAQYFAGQTITVTIYNDNTREVIDTNTSVIQSAVYYLQTTELETSHTKIVVDDLSNENSVRSSNGNLSNEELLITVSLAPFEVDSIIYGYVTASPIAYDQVGPPPSPTPEDQLQGQYPSEARFGPTIVNSFVVDKDVTAVFVTGSIIEHTETGDVFRVLYSTLDDGKTYVRTVETIPAYTPLSGSIKMREQIPGYSDSFLASSDSDGTLSSTMSDSISFSWSDGPSGTDVIDGYQYLIQQTSGNNIIVNGTNLEFSVTVGDKVQVLDNPTTNGIYTVTGRSGSSIQVTPNITTSQGGFVEKYTGA